MPRAGLSKPIIGWSSSSSKLVRRAVPLQVVGAWRRSRASTSPTFLATSAFWVGGAMRTAMSASRREQVVDDVGEHQLDDRCRGAPRGSRSRIGGSTSAPTISLAVMRIEPPSESAAPEASRTAAAAAAAMSCRCGLQLQRQVGGLQAARAAQEERRAQPLLQGLDVPAERRLGQAAQRAAADSVPASSTACRLWKRSQSFGPGMR